MKTRWNLFAPLVLSMALSNARAAEPAQPATLPLDAAGNIDPVKVKALFSCARDHDCTLIEGACPGLVAINKTLRAQATAYLASMAPNVDCLDVTSTPANPRSAACVKQRCMVHSPH